MTLRPSSSHEEGGVRGWSVLAKRLEGDETGNVRRLWCVRVEWDEHGMHEVPGSEHAIEADLVLIAIGFEGPERAPLLDALGVDLRARGNVRVDARFMTNIPGIFACGDASRGASLVVWAIHEGRESARAVEAFLSNETRLHLPVLAAE
jgi:glutamate synthase (NADPH/NADH) small chain